jgi:hypothetical protein
MRIRVIACEVLCREISNAASLSPHQVDVQFLEKGLHDYGGAAMRKELQFHIDATDPVKYDAVAMGYALCGNGLHGLRASRLPLVAPRAHDCIALLMGGRERYEEYFNANPGTFFRSTGWLERGKNLVPLAQVKIGVGVELQALIDKYGEDNGTYLFTELNKYQESYRRMVYIQTGLEADARFETEAKAEADKCGWAYSTLRGDLRLIRMLANAEWDPKDFLVVQPGQRIVARYDADVIHAERGEEAQ